MRGVYFFIAAVNAALFFAAHNALARCDECASKLAYVADFCFTEPAFPGMCVQFSEKQPNFLLLNGKKARYIPAASQVAGDYFLKDYRSRNPFSANSHEGVGN